MPDVGRLTYEVDANGCWICTSHRPGKRGYPTLSIGGKRTGKKWYAHRYVYQLCNGPIPEGLCVLHSCDMPLCINPVHLRVGTKLDNARDMVERRRQKTVPRFGSENKATKLSDDRVLYAREHSEISDRDVASQLGVSVKHVREIRKGRRRDCVPGPVRRDGRTSLTDEQVTYIREHPEINGAEMAQRLNVSKSTISAIRLGKTRNRAPGPIRGRLI